MKNKKDITILGLNLAVLVLFIITMKINVFSDSLQLKVNSFSQSEKRELRGVWITTVANLDWPSKKTRDILMDEQRISASKEELTSIVKRLDQLNANAVFFQVSPQADALYRSQIVPWSKTLSGTFGKDPGFDPLAFLIEEAHKHNIEVHAWFNPYRVSTDMTEKTKQDLSIPKSVYQEHPEWIRTANKRFVVDPGLPEVRQWTLSRVMEVVKEYDIDGIHFDDYFYYESYFGELDDKETFQKYKKTSSQTIQEFRRESVTRLIRNIATEIQKTKPWVKFGISPAAVWANKSDGQSEGSDTYTSFTNYDKAFADTKAWVQEEIIDYIAPQVYFSFSNPKVPYGVISKWWADLCRGKQVQLYLGLGLYKVNTDDDVSFQRQNAVSEFDRQLLFNQQTSNVQGSILFRYQHVNESETTLVIDKIKNVWWKAKVLPPVMEGKGGDKPASPKTKTIKIDEYSTTLFWEDEDAKTAYFCVYAIQKENNTVERIAKVHKEASGIQQLKLPTNPNVNYAVTSLDRLHFESLPSVWGEEASLYFKDLTSAYFWAIPAIDSLFAKGIVFGVDKNLYAPSLTVKRGDFILLLLRMLQKKVEFNDVFQDVLPTKYYYEAIGMAKQLGIIHGYNNKFFPEYQMTRQDMAVILYRAIPFKGKSSYQTPAQHLQSFYDASEIKSYAKDAFGSLVSLGIFKGEYNYLKPNAYTTRAEVAVILDRILQVWTVNGIQKVTSQVSDIYNQ